jgi:6-phosphogluconolactonase
MAHDVIVSETAEALAERVAADFAQLVKETVAQQARFTLALAGGQTPQSFYARLAKEPYRTSIPWEKVWIFWGDERCVPKEHSESNFRMAAESLLNYVAVPSSHVFRMRGEDPPPIAARDYQQILRDTFGSKPWPYGFAHAGYSGAHGRRPLGGRQCDPQLTDRAYYAHPAGY